MLIETAELVDNHVIPDRQGVVALVHALSHSVFGAYRDGIPDMFTASRVNRKRNVRRIHSQIVPRSEHRPELNSIALVVLGHPTTSKCTSRVLASVDTSRASTTTDGPSQKSPARFTHTDAEPVANPARDAMSDAAEDAAPEPAALPAARLPRTHSAAVDADPGAKPLQCRKRLPWAAEIPVPGT